MFIIKEYYVALIDEIHGTVKQLQNSFEKRGRGKDGFLFSYFNFFSFLNS